ncbi:PGF-CTERM sorting domain-containing protein [Halorubrum ezzemoulense]|uniref:PGF-CTERM sorting domain-containing protein n=1 Tax=Halorubrum ezzemoulense TaxID=337243 RepID=UPI00232FE375|nr:PGF-CTERM sorting domain-containing protein [Halorubrum ezzemoulense]MDB2226318.1 PGF-CTERM sorting domain-containing protein [Halorubrum ezzemoulense]
MERLLPFLTALLVIVSVGMAPGVVVADDKWADSCRNADVVSATDRYTGSIDSPRDEDVMKISVDKGDYVSTSLIAPQEADEVYVSYSERTSFQNVENAETGGTVGTPRVNVEGGVNANWEMWPENSDTYCLEIGGQGEAPYEWELSLTLNAPEPTSVETADSQNRIDTLENQINQKEERITELESILQQKNQTINELKSESTNNSSEDVSIEVTVAPVNDQENFVEGSEALVQAESDNADVARMSVGYGSGTYQLDSNGQVRIPLIQNGTQEMTLTYSNTTKQVSFEVQPQEPQNQQERQNQQDQQNEQDTTTTGTSVPGFGVAVTIVALVSSMFVIQRY